MDFFLKKNFFQRPKNTHSQCVFSDFLCSYVDKKNAPNVIECILFELNYNDTIKV